tara:strand:- start:1712 stop:2260 length:549 start_codon:yes stop_codon:yes gene_type:complete
MKSFRNESWKAFDIVDCDFEKEEILVSNYGRVQKKKKKDKEFKLYKKGIINKFETLSYVDTKNKTKSFYVHRAVAYLFLEKREDTKFVIHKNHDLTDNYVQNLKWVNQKELTVHQLTNPERKKKLGLITSAKLSEAKVRVIKKKLLDPNRRTRLRIIASQFGVSTMQLYRIKSGENWGNIEV